MCLSAEKLQDQAELDRFLPRIRKLADSSGDEG